MAVDVSQMIYATASWTWRKRISEIELYNEPELEACWSSAVFVQQSAIRHVAMLRPSCVNPRARHSCLASDLQTTKMRTCCLRGMKALFLPEIMAATPSRHSKSRLAALHRLSAYVDHVLKLTGGMMLAQVKGRAARIRRPEQAVPRQSVEGAAIERASA